MMSFCDDSEMAGIIYAGAKLKWRPHQDDQSLVSNGGRDDPNFVAGYEEMFAAVLTENPANFNRVLDPDFDIKTLVQNQKVNKGQRANWVSRPSQFFSKEFYGRVTEIETYFKEQVTKDLLENPAELARLFRKEAAPDYAALRLAIQGAYAEYNFGKTKEDRLNLDKEFADIGLKWNETKEAIEYLRYLESGMMYDVRANDVGLAFQRIAKNQASYNVAWSLFNMGDATKAIALGVGQKGWAKATVAGFKEMAEGFKRDVDTRNTDYGGRLGQVKTIENLSNELGQNKLNRYDPFTLSNRALERFTFAKAEALGQDPIAALGNSAFIFESHDAVPLIYKAKLGPTGEQAMIGLGRFMIAEFHYNVNNYANLFKMALQGAKPEFKRTPEQKRQALEFVASAALKASLFGPRSILPPFMYEVLLGIIGEDNKDLLEYGVVSSTATGLVKLVDSDATFSIGQAMAPTTVLLGARSRQLADVYGMTYNTFMKLAKDARKGDLDAFSALELLLMGGAVSSAVPASLRNVSGPVGILGKADEAAVMKELVPYLENQQMRTMVKAIVDGVREQDGKPMLRKVLEGAFGKQVVKND